MRPELAALQRAGITRARFSARYAGRSKQGFILLSDVETPIGGHLDHAWIRPWHWHGPIPAEPGKHVEFKAQIEPYWRDSGESDLGLFRLEVLP